MSDQSRILKQFEPIDCPHCKKSFYIGIHSMVSSIVSTPTMEDIKEAKERILSRLDEIKFKSDKEREGIINYLKNEDTIIDFSDIEPMLKQIAMDQI